MAKAALKLRQKLVLPDGAIIEMAIWQLPKASADRPHGLKYSLYYGKSGRRFVAYDNETGKGDHRHLGETETPYRFSTVERLVEDFLADVAAARGE